MLPTSTEIVAKNNNLVKALKSPVIQKPARLTAFSNVFSHLLEGTQFYLTRAILEQKKILELLF